MPRRFLELADAAPGELEELLRGGRAVAPESLADFLWHGYSLAMPSPLFKLFGHFGKTFAKDGERVRGWNVRMRQNVPGWEPALFRGRPVTYGHYVVVPRPAGREHEAYPNAFLVDYGKGGNRAWDPLACVRDWIVEVADDLLVGRMFLSLGGRSVATPSYFALARGGPLDGLVTAPLAR